MVAIEAEGSMSGWKVIKQLLTKHWIKDYHDVSLFLLFCLHFPKSAQQRQGIQQDRERSQSSGELKMRIHTCYINFLKLVQFQKEISSGTHVPKVTKWYPKIMSLLLDNVINIKEQGANNLKCNIITPLFAQKMRKSCQSKQKCCLPNNRVNKEAQKSRIYVCNEDLCVMEWSSSSAQYTWLL